MNSTQKDKISDCSPKARAVQRIWSWIRDGELRPGDIIPTEHSLAAKLGVSRGTVRSALHELTERGLLSADKGCRRAVARPERAVSETMRRAVVLLSGLEHIHIDWHQAPGHLAAIEGSAIAAIHKEGFHCLTIHPQRLGDECLASLCDDMPAGVLIPDPFAFSPKAMEVAERLRGQGIPVVFNADGGEFASFDRVVSDQAKGAEQLVGALAERGCKRLLRVWSNSSDRYWLRARDDGFSKAVGDAKLKLLPPLRIKGVINNNDCDRDLFESQSRLFAGFMLEAFAAKTDRPDAILATSDAEIPLVAAALRLLGAAPGADVLLAGFDNMWARLPERKFEPSAPVFTIDKKNSAIGEAMAKLVCASARGENAAEPRRVLIAPELVFSC